MSKAIEMINEAKRLSLLILAKNVKKAETEVPQHEQAVLNAVEMGKTINTMTNVCAGGKRDIAKCLNKLVTLIGASDKVAEIKNDYITSTSSLSRTWNAEFLHEKYSVLVPIESGMGVTKGQPVMYIGNNKWLKPTAKSGERDTYYGTGCYRLATEAELEKFFVALIGNYGLEGKLPSCFKVELPKEA